MKIIRLNERTIAIGPMDLFCTELLHQIRLSANPEGDRAAKERLFPSPTRGMDEEFDEEWIEYITPELAELFASSIQVIEKDLADFPPSLPADDHHTLELPISHLEAWIHGLNQARLVTAARYNFTEEDMDNEVPLDGDIRAVKREIEVGGLGERT